MTIEFPPAGGGGSLTLSGSSAPVPPMFTATYAATAAPSQVFRMDLEPDEEAVIHRLQIVMADGSVPSGVVFDIYDETNGTVLASTTDVDRGDEGEPLARTPAGVVLEGRLDNQNPSEIEASLFPLIQVQPVG